MEKSIYNSLPANPLIQGIKSFLGKLRQNPEVYPIRYYKKSKRFRRHWQAALVK